MNNSDKDPDQGFRTTKLGSVETYNETWFDQIMLVTTEIFSALGSSFQIKLFQI